MYRKYAIVLRGLRFFITMHLRSVRDGKYLYIAVLFDRLLIHLNSDLNIPSQLLISLTCCFYEIK